MGCNNKFDKKFFIRTSHECFFCKTQNIVYMTDFTYFVTFHLLFFSCRQTTATTRKAAKRHSHSAGKKDFDLLLEKKKAWKFFSLTRVAFAGISGVVEQRVCTLGDLQRLGLPQKTSDNCWDQPKRYRVCCRQLSHRKETHVMHSSLFD